jgi:hypothetical protein
MHKLLFYNKFIIFLYMFRALFFSSSGGQIVLYSIWYRHTVGGCPVRTERPPTECDDTSSCKIQFGLLMMSTTVLETCRGIADGHLQSVTIPDAV